MLVANKERRNYMLSTNIKETTEQLINLLKQLPKDKQEFVNGYVQGMVVGKQIAEQQKSA